MQSRSVCRSTEGHKCAKVCKQLLLVAENLLTRPPIETLFNQLHSYATTSKRKTWYTAIVITTTFGSVSREKSILIISQRHSLTRLANYNMHQIRWQRERKRERAVWYSTKKLLYILTNLYLIFVKKSRVLQFKIIDSPIWKLALY